MATELNARPLDRLLALRGRRGVLQARRVAAALLLLLAALLAFAPQLGTPPQQPEPARGAAPPIAMNRPAFSDISPGLST